MFSPNNNSNTHISPSTSPSKTPSILTKHRNSTLTQISKRKRETFLREKRLQNLDKFLQSPHHNLTHTHLQAFISSSSLLESFHSTDQKTLLDTLWALVEISLDPSRLDLVINLGIIPDLLRILGQACVDLLRPALKVLGNIIAGEKSQAEKVIEEPGFLQKIFELIGHEDSGIRKDVCWILSNIVLENDTVSQALVEDEESFRRILRIVKEDVMEVRREGMWILVNLTKRIKFRRIKRMVECGILDCFVEILDEDDVENVTLGLEGIMKVLECGEIMADCQRKTGNLFVEELKMNGGIGKIDDLQWDKNKEIHKKAERILEEFCDEEKYNECEISLEDDS